MNENFLKDLHFLLTERLADAESSLDDFEKGKHFGLYEAACLIQNQLEAFGIKSESWEKEDFDKFLNDQLRS